MTEMRGQLDPKTVRAYLFAAYLFAGNATFTVVSRRTGTRFTFKVSAPDKTMDGATLKPEDAQIHFVKVLTGSDNTSDYDYLGNIRNRSRYDHGRKSRVGITAPSVVAFQWFFNHPESDAIEVYHEGHCGRCGRKLTVPESVATGYGPDCAGQLGLAMAPRTMVNGPEPVPTRGADLLGSDGHYHAQGDRFDRFSEGDYEGQPLDPSEPVSQSNPILRSANAPKSQKPAPKHQAPAPWATSYDKALGF